MSTNNGALIYQVIGNYEVVDTGKNDILVASKGDIIVDCEKVDENWFRGKNTRSGLYGLIPKANVVSLQQHEYSELEPELLEKLSEEGVDIASSSKENSGDVEPNQKVKTLADSSYVDMSSEETLNCLDEKVASKDDEALLPKKSPMPKPPRHPSVSDSSKNDEGYNSASHYSGENADSNQPLLKDASKTDPKEQDDEGDEAGYEVPDISVKFQDEEKGTKQRQRKKKKSLMMLWKGKNSETESQVLNDKTPADEARESYYDPPADIRDNYFLPYTSKPTFRVVLSFIAALGISITLFLVLLLLAKLHAVLCVTISLLVFIILFVVPVTLYHRGILCVMLLLFPSLFGTRTKIAVVILLIVFGIVGPLFGTADKIHLARSCALHGADWFEKNDTRNEVTGGLHDDCVKNFRILAEYCSRTVYPNFEKLCDRRKDKSLGEQILCNKPKSYFCWNQTSLVDNCDTKPPLNHSTYYNVSDGDLKKLEVTNVFKNILFYLFPLLALFILSEAYSYNKVYLTTKNTDNIYITQRLRELDTERRNRGLTDLILPLTRIELYTYLVRRNWNTTKAERTSVLKWLAVLLICVFLNVSLIVIEDAVNSVLQNVQTGECLLVYNDRSSIYYRNVIYALLGGFLFIIIMQSHCLRLRSVVCDYIYPEMVETRSKHLYYKILHDRHAFARHVRRNIQLLSEEKRLRLRISFFSKIYAVLPKQLQRICNVFIIRTCMICDSLSYRKTVECTKPTCRAHYCFECHVDAGQNCLTCKTSAPKNANLPGATRSSFCV